MKFEVELTNGEKRRILFKHIDNQKTVCRMDIIDQKTGRWTNFFTSIAVCSDCDVPNKWLGKKIALSRLTRNMTKADRWFVWKKYFDVIATDLLLKNLYFNQTKIQQMKSFVKLASQWNEAINPRCKCHRRK